MSIEDCISNLEEIRDTICTGKYETETSLTFDTAIELLKGLIN